MRINIRGFELIIKSAFFVLLMIMIALGYIEQFFIFVISVSIHEFSHILMAKLFKLKITGVIITPVGESAIIKDIEKLHILKRILVVMAGPMISVLIGLMFRGSFFGYVNLVIGLFNLLPIYPLDGGRILQYWSGYYLGVLRANRLVCKISNLFSYLVLFCGLMQMVLYFCDITLLCVGLYLIKINKREYFNMTFQFYKSIVYKSKDRVLPVKNITVTEVVRLKTVVYRLGWDYYTIIYVRGKNGNNLTIGEDEVLTHVLKDGINKTFCDVLLENTSQICNNKS